MQSIHPMRSGRSARVALVAAVLVLLGFVGLRPAAPALAACGGVTKVSSGSELENAINIYNFIPGPCIFGIEFEGDILLTSDLYYIINAFPSVELVIDGAGFKLDAQDNVGWRPITIRDGIVTIKNLTITGGNVVNANGGGIYNAGDLTLTNVTVEGNNAQVESGYWELGGGGIVNYGEATITDSVITGNTVTANDNGWAGGILNLGTMTLIRSTVSDNEVNVADSNGRGGGIFNAAALTILDSAIINNTIESVDEDAYGVGIYSTVDDFAVEDQGHDAQLIVINSTISNNSATTGSWSLGGGLFAENPYASLTEPVVVTLINVTLTENSLTTQNRPRGGSGMYIYPKGDFRLTVQNSIVVGNLSNDSPYENCNFDGSPASWSAHNNLFQINDEDDCELNPGNPNGNIFVETPDLGPLGFNGGPTMTHLPNPTSPAINAGRNDLAVDEGGNSLMADQRGYIDRIEGTVDMGAVETEARDPEAVVNAVFMSAAASGTAPGIDGPFQNSDILKWDGTEWSVWFDGSAALLAPNNKSKHNVNAFWIPDPDEPDVVMSFAQNGRKVGDLPDKVDGMDLVWWDGTSFSLWFDGSDVGLTKKTPEKIDGLHVLPTEEAPEIFADANCLYYLLISTQGPGAVPQFGGGVLKFGGEDVLGFCMTNFGANTAGFWHMVLDGSAEGVKKNAIDSISLGDDGVLYLTSKATFDVDFAVGGHSMVYAYVASRGGGGGAGGSSGFDFTGPHFVAADNGLTTKVDGLQVNGTLLPVGCRSVSPNC